MTNNNLENNFKLFSRSESMIVDTIALILVIIGALNWGSIGIFNVDLVSSIFGGTTAVVSRIIFTLVGLAGLWCITLLFRETNSSPEKHHIN